MLFLLSTLLLSLLSLANAQLGAPVPTNLPSAPSSSSGNGSAIFVYNGDDNTQFIFALNADKSSGDLYFHLSSPAGNAWVGVGIGTQMKDSLMLIAYPSSNGTGVTISPRIGYGHSEPIYQSNITVDKIYGNDLSGANTVSGGRSNTNIVTDGVCRGCAVWKTGALDYTSTNQPFIFAVGPTFPPMNSNSQNAGISYQHIFDGHFTMDMTAATSSSGGSVPAGPYTTSKSASSAINTQFTSDPAPHIHGLVMCIVFIIILPVGALLLRVWNKPRAHAIVQTIGFVLFLMAFAGGSVASGSFNRTKNFTSGHQILGILILLAMISQWVLGFMHHRIFKREQRKTMMGKIHLYLGPAVIVFGLLNGAVGIALAGPGIVVVPYIIVVVIFAAIYTCIRGAAWFRRRRRQPKEPEGYQYPQFGGANQAPGGYSAGGYSAPPPYSQDVPLQQYRSTDNVSQYRSTENINAPPVQPRNMI